VYDIRDLLGHFVKPREREGEMCPHACCRGRRPHPERRDKAAKKRARRRERESTSRDEFRAHLENEWIKAEEQTRGNMLNRAGQRADIDPRSLFTGPESRARKYASEELRRYWEDHPRVSPSEFGSEAAQLRGGRRRHESRLYGVY
jgi:hypothetical protein